MGLAVTEAPAGGGGVREVGGVRKHLLEFKSQLRSMEMHTNQQVANHPKCKLSCCRNSPSISEHLDTC